MQKTLVARGGVFMEKNIKLSSLVRKKLQRKCYVIREIKDQSITIFKNQKEIVNIYHQHGSAKLIVKIKGIEKGVYQSVEVKIDKEKGVYLLTQSLAGMKWCEYCE